MSVGVAALAARNSCLLVSYRHANPRRQSCQECSFNLANPFYAGALAHVIEEILRSEERRSSLGEQVSPSGRISGTPSKAVAGAVKETSQGTFAKGVDTKWPETQTVAKGVTSLLPRKSDEIFNFKPSPRREETVSVPPRG